MLDRSNQTVGVLLGLLNSAQMDKVEHVHECYQRGMDFATWYEENGKGSGGAGME